MMIYKQEKGTCIDATKKNQIKKIKHFSTCHWDIVCVRYNMRNQPWCPYAMKNKYVRVLFVRTEQL